MEAKRKSGRPRKAEHEKVQYQRIAVYASDYERLTNRLAENDKITEVFTQMVDNFLARGRRYTARKIDELSIRLRLDELDGIDRRIDTEFEGDLEKYLDARRTELNIALDNVKIS